MTAEALSLPTIVSVRLFEGRKQSLIVELQDGRVLDVDLSSWIDGGGVVLAPLKSDAVFATAHVGDFGRSIEWGDEEDLAIDSSHVETIGTRVTTAHGTSTRRRIG